uniref:Remorin_C domain-containing protein n=1 Tax=Meloidogyne hapla TaxID=6305 RepID=A0A1I8BJX1_MELHA
MIAAGHRTEAKALEDQKRMDDTNMRRLVPKKEIQKGIEKAKNRLKSSLNEAIDDGRNLENSRPTQLRQEKHDSSDIIDSVSLQAAIERIEEPGFRPCSFKSDADSARSSSTTKGSETASTLFTSSATTQHDRAMFGPLWASKQIAEKATNKKEAVKKRTDEKPDEEKKEETNVPASRFPMAHEKVRAYLNI